MTKFFVPAALALTLALSPLSPVKTASAFNFADPAEAKPAASEEKPADPAEKAPEKVVVKVPADPKSTAAEEHCELHHHAQSGTYYHPESDSFYRYDTPTKTYRLSHPSQGKGKGKAKSSPPAYFLQKGDPRKYN